MNKAHPRLEEAIELYLNGMTGASIYRTTGVSWCGLKAHLTKRGIPIVSMQQQKIKYPINEDFFECIDTQEKAYILGYIYADGHVNKTRVDLRLSEKDHDILVAMRSFIYKDESRPIHKVPAKSTVINGRTVNQGPQSRLTVTNKTIAKDLASYGLVSNKLTDIHYPMIPKTMHKHFVRGFFDGDGSINVSNVGHPTDKYQVRFIAVRHFGQELKSVIENETGCTCSFVENKRTPTHPHLQLAGRLNCKRLGKWMYTGSSIELARKRVNFPQ